MTCNIGPCVIRPMLNSLLATSLCIIVLVVLLPQPIVGVDVELGISWSEALKARVDDIETNELMVEQVISVINKFDGLDPPDRQYPDSGWVDLLANEISILLESKAAVAKNLASEVESLYLIHKAGDDDEEAIIYDSVDPTTWDDNFTASLVFDDRYQVNLSYTYSTVRHPDYAQDTSSSSVIREAAWHAPLDDSFRSYHIQDPKLESLYFASSSGHLRAFPGGPWTIKALPNSPSSASYANLNNNGFIYRDADEVKIAGFNAKFLPWYVLGASGPKDVVLVLDASTSMGNLYEVRKAAINVVSGLSAQDYVNVVVFNTNAVVSSCWPNRLARATENNKQIITNYLMDLDSASGRTNIQSGIQLGLELLDNSVNLNQSSQCSQLVILLTDGVTSATHFSIDNTQDARLFVYVLNTYTDTSPLQRLACANNGVLVPVPNPSSAYVQMGMYYHILAPGMASADPVWVGPYLNQFTEVGLVFTVTYPCYDRTQSPPELIGVVGVDVPMDQIDAIARNYVAHPSYSFIVNNIGEALVHPHLPLGIQYTSEPSFFDIADIEGLSGNSEFEQIRRDMIYGKTGNHQLNKISELSRGLTNEGMQTWNSTVQYYYRRLHGDLSVAIAWTTLNSKEPDVLVPSLRARVTHLTPDAYHTNQQGAFTSFSVAAKGYCDPVQFIETREDVAFSNLVISSVDAPMNASCPEELLRSEARLAIQASSNIGGLWNSSFYDAHPEVKVRFIATHHSGVMRTFPGHTFVSKYDPTSVDWYRRALALDSGDLAVSVPQTHLSAGDVLSSFEQGKYNTMVFSRVVPYVTDSNTVTTYGVIGMSVDYAHISEIFLDSVDNACRYTPISQSRASGVRCLWLDGNGYILTHQRFLYSLPPKNASYIFLGSEEPLLAASLVAQGVLVPEVSIDFSTGKKVKVSTYTFVKSAFQPHASGVMYINGTLPPQQCAQKGNYFVSKIGSTNTYLAILNVTDNSLCAYYSPPTVNFETQTIVACSEPIVYSTYATCNAESVSFDDMEEIRGIQSCRSESNAIILGILIPLGIGATILCLIWFIRRRKRMSRQSGMLVGNMDNLDNLDRAENEPEPPRDPNLPNPQHMEINVDNVPSFVVDPHVNHETIVIRQDDNPRSSPPSRNNSNININNLNLNVGNNNNTVNLRHSSSSAVLRSQLTHRRTTHHSPPASPPSTQPNLRTSFMYPGDDPYSHNTTSLSSALRNSNPYTNNIYYSEGGEEDISGGRGIAMHVLPLTANVYNNDETEGTNSEIADDDNRYLNSSHNTTTTTTTNNNNNNNNKKEDEEEAEVEEEDEEEDEEQDEEEEEDEEDEDEDEDEDEESEGDGGSGSEGERVDPDDMFGMAREMGIALPRAGRY